MTITFPKFPNKRRQNTAQNDSVTTEGDSSNLPLNNHDEVFTPTASNADTNTPVPPEQLAQLKQQLLTPTAQPKKNKLLPILVGGLIGAGLGAVAYPMYQNMAEEKAAVVTPVATPKPAVATKPASAPTTTANVPASSPAAVVGTAPTAQPTSPASETASPPAKADDLQKPLLVDNAPSNPQDNAKTTPSNNEAVQPATADGKAEVKAKSEVKTEIKAESKSDNSNSQAPTIKPNSGKGAMSYDDFIKTSDSSVFIEAPARQK